MAAYTSSQSGDFNAAATWGGGGYPSADGDTFSILTGHDVKMAGTPPTNGFGDSTIYGKLYNDGTTTFRMNGILRIWSNGIFHATSGLTLEFKGGETENHGLWIENVNNTHVIMEGSDPLPTTTISTANVAEGAGVYTVTSNAGFAIGEWIMMFDNHSTGTSYYGANGYHQWHDEAFWIHDIDGSDIYVRNFVGPDDVTITNVRTNRLTVSNAKKYREGEQIIFGTGSNRNLLTIDSINYKRNVLFCNTNISNTSAVVGETVYHSYSRFIRWTNDKVRKIATVTTTTTANTGSTISVASATDFAVGDDIIIERRSECEGTGDYQGYWSSSSYKEMRHTISSISGNDITLDAVVGYNVVEGAYVSRLTRDIVVKGVSTSDYFYIYKEHPWGDYSPTFIVKDVYMNGAGNDNSTVYTGLVFRGYANTNSVPVTLTEQIPQLERAFWIEGVTIYCEPNSTRQRDWGPIWSYDARSSFIRGCIVMNGDDGISTYYEPYMVCTGNITCGQDSYGTRIEGPSDLVHYAYNHLSRSYYGPRMHLPYQAHPGVHDIIVDAVQYSMSVPGLSVGSYERIKCTGVRYGMNDEGSEVIYVNMIHKNLSGSSRVEEGTGTAHGGIQYRMQNARMPNQKPILSVEHEFEYDQMRVYGYQSESIWDNDENAWRFYRRYDNSDNPGLCESLWVPPNTTVRVTAKVKLAPGFSGTYPRLSSLDQTAANFENALNYSGGKDSARYSGHWQYVDYTSAAASDYEEKQLTISSVAWARYLNVSVYSSSSNAAEGYWVKEFQIYLDKPYPNPAFNLINREGVLRNNGIVATIRNSFTQQKKRLGGRLK
jgi:hypothetical protein